MKMIVRSIITSTFDVDSGGTGHTIEIEDEDGLADVHRDMLGAVVLGGLRASEKAVLRTFPGVAALPAARRDSDETEED